MCLRLPLSFAFVFVICKFAFACVCLLSLFVFARLFVLVRLFCVGLCCVSYYTCVYIECVFRLHGFGLLVCACVIVLRVIVYAFALLRCKVAFHISCACKLHVCGVSVFCLFVFVCLFCE